MIISFSTIIYIYYDTISYHTPYCAHVSYSTGTVVALVLVRMISVLNIYHLIIIINTVIIYTKISSLSKMKFLS